MESSLTIEQGKRSTVEPYAGGTLAFALEPGDATCILAPGTNLDTTEDAKGLAVGTYDVVLKKPGYRDLKQKVTIGLGKKTTLRASLERLAPGKLVLTAYGRLSASSSKEVRSRRRRRWTGSSSTTACPRAILSI